MDQFRVVRGLFFAIFVWTYLLLQILPLPGHRLPFKKFISAYEEQFKQQCRFADYGFANLVEMFRAIPNTVQITMDGDGKKIVRLNRNHLDKSSGHYISRQGLDSSQGYGSTGYRVFKHGVQDLKDFCQRTNITNGNYWILRIGDVGRCTNVPKFDFQSQFSISKLIHFFFHWRIWV